MFIDLKYLCGFAVWVPYFVAYFEGTHLNESVWCCYQFTVRLFVSSLS
nr:MAG TPA: hypothetical protein [Caudoviricetes sp.]